MCLEVENNKHHNSHLLATGGTLATYLYKAHYSGTSFKHATLKGFRELQTNVKICKHTVCKHTKVCFDKDKEEGERVALRKKKKKEEEVEVVEVGAEKISCNNIRNVGTHRLTGQREQVRHMHACTRTHTHTHAHTHTHTN